MARNIFSFWKKRKQQKMNNTSVDNIPNRVYVQDCVKSRASKLYILDLQTGQADLIGSITANVVDLAVVSSQLYGIQQSEKTTQLITIDRSTGKPTIVGDIGFNVVGLAYSIQRKTLYATAAKQLIAIDLKTGKGTPVITVSRDRRGCGEIAFDSRGKAYITLISPNKKKQLAICDLDNRRVRVIGNTGFPDLASIEFIDDILYGVTGNFFDLGKDGQIICIDTKTGKGKLVTKTNPLCRWAGMTRYEAAVVSKNETEDTTNKNTINNSKQIVQNTVEETMQLLTIDTKENCYVINPDGMNDLQLNIASKFTLDKGVYEIKIAEGEYSYAQSEQAEPFVLLWIYGTDGSTFVNQKPSYSTATERSR